MKKGNLHRGGSVAGKNVCNRNEFTEKDKECTADKIEKQMYGGYLL